MVEVVPVGAEALTREQVRAVAREAAPVELTPRAREAVKASRGHIEALAADPLPHYGVSTGFGALATTHIPPDRRAALQRSLIRSHAAGAGEPVEPEVVRAMMLLRLRTLASGHTGVRPETVDALTGLLNAGLVPVVHEFGSLGCSGDLAPLSAVGLALMGEGEIVDGGTRKPAAQALREHGIEAVQLAEKEGLALINGTDGMLGMLVLAVHDLAGLLDAADLTAAMSTEALLGTDRAFAADLQALRPHRGQAVSAARMTAFMAGSAIVASHRTPDCTRVQDAYSMRCAPQVHGAARDTLAHTVSTVDVELESIVDNPVVLADGRVESNGNFHGAPLGYVADFLAIAVADVASMSERRTDRMLDKARSHGLPPFLADDPGVDSGLMIAQYTQAALVNELKRLAAPASVDSIPTSGMQEDHVSMGWAAARKLRRALDGLGTVLAVEAMTAARALDLRAPLQPAPATGAAVAALRAAGVHGPGPDRHLAPEIAAAERVVRGGALNQAVAQYVNGRSE
jgi:histidine ammonia-lyase